MAILKKIYDLTQQKREIEKQLKELWAVVEAQEILEEGKYSVKIREDQVRHVIPAQFLSVYGQEMFNKVASIQLRDATREIPAEKLEEAGCIDYTPRIVRMVEYRNIKIKAKAV